MTVYRLRVARARARVIPSASGPIRDPLSDPDGFSHVNVPLTPTTNPAAVGRRGGRTPFDAPTMHVIVWPSSRIVTTYVFVVAPVIVLEPL